MGVQEALAFGGVRTTQPQLPKEAAPPKPTGPTQKEVRPSTSYFNFFVLASLILLVAMIGAIVLTLQKTVMHRQ